MESNINFHTSQSQIADALAAVRRFVKVLRTVDASTARSTGLSSAQLLVLQLLAESDADSVNDLARRTMTDQSSVSVVVARLEIKGLVSRAPSPTDARRTAVSITPDGRLALQGAPLNLQERLVYALRRIQPEALCTLTEELSNIVALMGAAHDPPTFFFEDDATGSG